jgi:hypothetical protein
MAERQVPCPRCPQENPPTNRYCGSCGVPLTSGEQLATRQEHSPVQAGRAWPAKLGPAGKALAVGVAVLAAEAGLSWLQRRIGTEERSSLPADRDAGSARLARISRQPEPGRSPRPDVGGSPQPGPRAARGPSSSPRG